MSSRLKDRSRLPRSQLWPRRLAPHLYSSRILELIHEPHSLEKYELRNAKAVTEALEDEVAEDLELEERFCSEPDDGTHCLDR